MVTKVVIVDRLAGRYSEQFDSREDAERALRFFMPFTSTLKGVLGQRYEVLECQQVIDNQWWILDPKCPHDTVWYGGVVYGD